MENWTILRSQKWVTGNWEIRIICTWHPYFDPFKLPFSLKFPIIHYEDQKVAVIPELFETLNNPIRQT